MPSTGKVSLIAMRRRVSVSVSSTPGPRRDTIIAASSLPPLVEQRQRGPVTVRSQIVLAAAVRPLRGRAAVQLQTDPAAVQSQIVPGVALSPAGRRPPPRTRVVQSQTGPAVALSPTGRRPPPHAQRRLLALRRSIRGMGLRPVPPRPEGMPVVSRWEALPEAVPRAAVFMAAVAVVAPMAEVVLVEVAEVGAVAADGIVEGRLMRTSDTRLSALCVLASAMVACIELATAAFAAETVAQKTFPSAEAAVTAVVDDLRSENLSDLMAILGPGAERLLNSGDPVADRHGRERFVASYDDAHHLEETQHGAILVVGKEDWPIPIPLRRVDDLWSFDTEAGEQQMIDRRIGRNELDTIQTMLAYVDGQQDYADSTLQHTGTAAYAREF